MKRRHIGSGSIIPLMLMLLLLSGPEAFALDANALPTGGKITAGTGSISQSGSKMTVTQTTNRMIADWSTFNIGRNASVAFAQPGSSSVALNRIYDQNPSLIYGSLTANGQVFLVNNAGIYFGPTAQVNVGGLVASSLNITKENFLAGNYLFEKSGTTAGAIVNQGSIRTPSGGYIAFISPAVSNEGSLTSPGGTVAMAAGDRVSLDFTGDNLVNFTVDKGAVDALIENKGLISADGGAVILTAKAADSVTKAVVNNSGIIEARTMENRSGRILLLSDMESGEVIAGGTLDASALKGGNGGFIETSAKKVTIKDGLSVNTSAPLGKTGIWLIDPDDFTISAANGDMTGAQVTAALATSNLTIASVNGGTSGNGDIFVNDSVTWSQNTLTLKAERNIEINSALYGSGTAGLAVYYGLESGTGWISGGGTYATCSANAPVNLASTGSFSTKLGTSGTLKSYTIITSLGDAGSTTGIDLQGMQSNLSGKYVLGTDIDASATASWNGSAGFDPVGNLSTKFTGIFDGLGHTITGLTINRPSTDYVGLFGYTDGAAIRNVGLVGGSVTGSINVGGLMGRNYSGDITNTYSTGSVTGSRNVGGLAGANSGTIDSSYSTGSVTGSQYVGGLAGVNSGTIDSSYSTGSVTGSLYVGGLAGALNGGGIGSSYSTGSVTGSQYVGGLVGWNMMSSIYMSYSTGSVTGSSNVGGLVGANTGGDISYSYWDMETSGRTTSSGGTGRTTAEMKQLSNFSGWDSTGTRWRIYDGHSYPLLKAFLTPLTVTANDVTTTYNATAYSGGNGVIYSTTPSGLLFGTLTYNGTSQGAKNARTYVITPSGLYSTSQQGYDITYVDGSLTINPASLTITANDYSRTYNGSAYSGGNGVTYAGFVGGETTAVLTGVLSYTGTSQGAKNAGSHLITPGGFMSHNYSITYADGALTINPAPLTITGTSAASKVYDGTTAATVTAGTLSGLIGTETLSVSGTGTFDSKNAGSRTATAAYTLTDGTNGGLAGNYTLADTTGLAANITKASLTVTANSDYVAYGVVPYTGGNGVSYTGLLGGDTSAVLGGSLLYGGSSQRAVNRGTYGIDPYGLTSGNYDISFVPGVLTIGADTGAYTGLVESSQVSKPNPADAFAKVKSSGAGSATIEGLISANLVSTGNEVQYSRLANGPRRNFTITIHSVDTEDNRKISGIVENLEGSGRHVPFRDIEELAKLLNK